MVSTMVLPAQIYADVVSTIREAEAHASTNEMRKAIRLHLQITVKIQILHQGNLQPPTLGVLRDFSSHGIGFLYCKPLPANTRFLMHLPRNRGNPVLVVTKVKHSRPMAEGIFQIGAEFGTLLSDNAIKRMMAHNIPLLVA